MRKNLAAASEWYDMDAQNGIHQISVPDAQIIEELFQFAELTDNIELKKILRVYKLNKPDTEILDMLVKLNAKLGKETPASDNAPDQDKRAKVDLLDYLEDEEKEEVPYLEIDGMMLPVKSFFTVAAQNEYDHQYTRMKYLIVINESNNESLGMFKNVRLTSYTEEKRDEKLQKIREALQDYKSVIFL